jgi:adenylosuccinate synthase
MSVTCIFGMQWGDEGKGRLVDLVARRSEVVVRYQGGANAGHTVIVGDEKYVLHMLPSGAIQPHTTNVVANGVVVDPWTLLEEVDDLARRGIGLDGRLLVSDRAHVVLPYHRLMDRAMEQLRGRRAIGTTSRGIGPAYGDKAMREGLRIADLMRPSWTEERFRENLLARNEILEKAGMDPLDADEAWASTRRVAERLAPYVADTMATLLDAWDAGRSILLEGAQGYGLDVDQGSYPYVTSSHTGTAGVAAGTGLPPCAIDTAVGVVKAYTTRVGAGPFPTRDEGPAGRHMAERGREFGATTGRPRDCGAFDAVLARRAARTQGVDRLAIMKLDVLSGLETLAVCVAYELDGRRLDAPPAYAADWTACRPVYETLPGWGADVSGVRRFEDLPPEARGYVERLQELVGVPVGVISVGAEREQFIETGEGLPVPA